MAVSLTLAERIDRLLPQTQCGQCGFDGCLPYAQALARGEADIDHCPPGGDSGALALAKLLNLPPRPYDRSRGLHAPDAVVVIIEDDCIGCTKCIQACPVDAIIGTAKLMHTVIPELCTGCELCIPACPVDCMQMEYSRPSHPAGQIKQSDHHKNRQGIEDGNGENILVGLAVA